MIQLFPQTDDSTVDPLEAIPEEGRPRPTDRPWVYTNMIASADGGTAVDGVSGQLGGPADRQLFTALRSVADIILAGASTVRSETYSPPKPPAAIQLARQQRGQAARPRIAIVSGSLALDLDLPVFSDPENRPLIVTSRSASPERVGALEPVADLIMAGETDLDLGNAVGQIGALGAATILCEGGPSINGQMIEADLIDEWNLSLSPHLLAADSRRAAVGKLSSGPPQGMRLSRVWTLDDYLFCRWTRA